MENKNDYLSVINGIASVIFTVMSFFGFMGIADMIGRGNDIIIPNDIAFTGLFIVGVIGLIIQLLIYNLRMLKR